MRRNDVVAAAFLVLVLAPAAVLGWFSIRLAGRDRDEGARRLVVARDDEVAAAVRRLGRELAFAEKADWSRKVEAWIDAAGGVRYRPTPRLRPAPSAEALARYRRAVAAGEHYEFAERKPALALDAYAFYLREITDPTLQARLRLRTARAASAAGRDALGEAMLRRLCRPVPDDAATVEDRASFVPSSEAGVPIDVLAAALLLRRDPSRAGEFLRRVDASRHDLTTEQLEHFARLSPDTERRRDVLRRVAWRRRLEAIVDVHPELRASRDAVIDEWPDKAAPGPRPHVTHLVVAKTDADGARRVALYAMAAMPLVGSTCDLRFESTKPDDATSVPVRLDGTGAIAGWLTVAPRGDEPALAALDRRYHVQLALVFGLGAVTIAGALSLLMAMRRARRLNRLRDQLLANVTHELKTPITSIRMFSEMLAEDPLDESRTRRFGKLMRAESQRLSQLVANILDFSRIDRTEQEIEREPVDVAGVLHRVAEGFRYRAEEKRVTFGGDLPESLVAVTHAPSVERIVLNLLDNALKYRSPDRATVRLDATREHGQLSVRVTDNGRGIPAAECERVFEPFHRVQYDDYGVRGSGLGLSISRRLARALGGDVTLESTVGAGSTFTLRIPAPEQTA